jgi:hypothetical protein
LFCFFPVDFEGEADPFADLELKTLNDLAELQTILTGDRSSSSGGPPRQLNGINGLSSTGNMYFFFLSKFV